MRRQGQHYHQDVNAYGDQMRHAPSQRMDSKSGSGNFQRRELGVASERGLDYGNARDEEQWRSERDGLNISYPHMLNEVHRGEFQSSFGSQGSKHPLFQHPREDLDIQYADDSMSRSFDRVENKFLDEIMKLVREQKDSEDAEYIRHKEKLETINVQYQEQVTTLRANQARRREVLLQNESNARQQQYQQAIVDQYSNNCSNNPQSYDEASPNSTATRYANRQRNDRSKEPYEYNQRGRFSTGPEDDHSYQSGRIYDDSRGLY